MRIKPPPEIIYSRDEKRAGDDGFYHRVFLDDSGKVVYDYKTTQRVPDPEAAWKARRRWAARMMLPSYYTKKWKIPPSEEDKEKVD